MKKDYSALIWGLLFVAVGIIFGGNALDIWDIDIFFPGLVDFIFNYTWINIYG